MAVFGARGTGHSLRLRVERTGQRMQPGLANYFAFLFQPFFRWWWAVITGFASIISLLVTPQSGFVLGQAGVALITFLVLTLAFLTLSTTLQGWQLYRKRCPDLRVSGVQKTQEYGGEYIALLCGDMEVP